MFFLYIPEGCSQISVWVQLMPVCEIYFPPSLLCGPLELPGHNAPVIIETTTSDTFNMTSSFPKAYSVSGWAFSPSDLGRAPNEVPRVEIGCFACCPEGTGENQEKTSRIHPVPTLSPSSTTLPTSQFICLMVNISCLPPQSPSPLESVYVSNS